MAPVILKYSKSYKPCLAVASEDIETILGYGGSEPGDSKLILTEWILAASNETQTGSSKSGARSSALIEVGSKGSSRFDLDHILPL